MKEISRNPIIKVSRFFFVAPVLVALSACGAAENPSPEETATTEQAESFGKVCMVDCTFGAVHCNTCIQYPNCESYGRGYCASHHAAYIESAWWTIQTCQSEANQGISNSCP
jgi:hypothetical protein